MGSWDDNEPDRLPSHDELVTMVGTIIVMILLAAILSRMPPAKGASRAPVNAQAFADALR